MSQQTNHEAWEAADAALAEAKRVAQAARKTEVLAEAMAKAAKTARDAKIQAAQHEMWKEIETAPHTANAMEKAAKAQKAVKVKAEAEAGAVIQAEEKARGTRQQADDSLRLAELTAKEARAKTRRICVTKTEMSRSSTIEAPKDPGPEYVPWGVATIVHAGSGNDRAWIYQSWRRRDDKEAENVARQKARAKYEKAEGEAATDAAARAMLTDD